VAREVRIDGYGNGDLAENDGEHRICGCSSERLAPATNSYQWLVGATPTSIWIEL
jgi:hypothetical protein